MGEILKILGQAIPTANVLRDLYTVPANSSAAISSITICNQNNSTVLFRMSVAKNGVSDTPSQYVYYDLPLVGNDTFVATIGISLAATDVVRVQCDTANVSFNLLGVELGVVVAPPIGMAAGDLDGYYPNPTVVAIQNNPVVFQTLDSSTDGYGLIWDNADGYWKAGPVGGGGGAVIFDSGSPSSNARTDRTTDQSAIVNTFQGIVNLSSDTSGVAVGANGNFATISGGDQNTISSDFGVISGGQANTISELFPLGAIADTGQPAGDPITGSAASITITPVVGLTASGLSISTYGPFVYIYGFSGTGGDYGYTLTISGAANPENNGNFIIVSDFSIGLGYTIYNPNSPQGDDANNGSISTTGFVTQINGLTGMAPINAGGAITISGSSTPSNNGTFPIFDVYDDNDIGISNPNAATDPSGAVVWVVSNQFSSIGSGQSNQINSAYSNILAGNYNTTYGPNSIVSGQFNATYDNYSTCLGGFQNTIGGQGNTNTGGVIIGGIANTAYGQAAVVVGGVANIAGGDYSAIIGGNGCFVTAFSVAGGNSCTATNESVAFGYSNSATGSYSTCLGFDGSATGLGALCVGPNQAIGKLSVAFGFQSKTTRLGQISISSSGGNINGNYGDTQNGNLVLGSIQTTVGTPFVLKAVISNEEFALETAQYYNFHISIVVMSSASAGMGPAYWTYDVLAHVAGGLAIIDNQQQTITVPDPNLTGWLTSITVDGTTNILHINIDPNTDLTNLLSATADIRWAEVAGFSQ